MKKKRFYSKSKVTIKKIKVSFLSGKRRALDGMSHNDTEMLLANWQCSPCCSCCG